MYGLNESSVISQRAEKVVSRSTRGVHARSLIRGRRSAALIALSVCLCASTSRAVDYSWNAVSGDWSTSGDWTPSGVPGSNDTATVSNGGTLTVTNSDAVSSAGLWIGNAGNGALTVSGGTLTFGALNQGDQYLYLGVGSGSSGTVTQSGGTVQGSENNAIYVGYNGGAGSYVFTGGTLKDPGLSTLTVASGSTYNQSGTSSLSLSGINVSANGSFLFSSGNISGSSSADVLNLRSSGSFNQSGGTLGTNVSSITASTGNFILSGGSQTTTTFTASGAAVTLSGTASLNCSTLKLSDGTLKLSGGSISLGAPGFVWSGGTLLVETPGWNLGGTVFVPNSGTLGGNGGVADPVEVESDGTLSPGNSPGILSTGALTLDTGSTLLEQVMGNSPGGQTGYDQTIVDGTVDLNDASLAFDLGYQPSVGDSYTILSNEGGVPVTGTFLGLPQDSTFAVGTDVFQINYVGGAGNDVVIDVVAVPEPVTVVPVAIGLIALTTARRNSAGRNRRRLLPR
jgi:fibronectin-binding autotransporter adhesin